LHGAIAIAQVLAPRPPLKGSRTAMCQQHPHDLPVEAPHGGELWAIDERV
jgi:hypothetical protein